MTTMDMPNGIDAVIRDWRMQREVPVHASNSAAGRILAVLQDGCLNAAEVAEATQINICIVWKWLSILKRQQLVVIVFRKVVTHTEKLPHHHERRARRSIGIDSNAGRRSHVVSFYRVRM